MKSIANVFVNQESHNSMESVRLQFISHLINGFIDNTNILEIFNGVNTIDQVMDVSLAQKFNRINLSEINFDCNKSASSKFENFYDHIVWFNGLNWTRPNQKKYIDWCNNKLKIDGILHISFAGKSSFINNENIELQIGNKIRNFFSFEPIKHDFDSKRFKDDELADLFGNFHIFRYEKIDVDLIFNTYEAFSDWHIGSAKCILGDLELSIQTKLREEFITELFDIYMKKEYIPRLTTCIFNVRKLK